MIPYKDDNPTTIRPFVTHALVVANVLIFIMVWSWHDRAVWDYGFLPWELLSGQRHPDSPALGGWSALFSSMFMHGGLMHLGGNMLFLWVFGDNVEEAMGHIRFLLFYLLCGLLAHAAQLGWLYLQAGAPPALPLSLNLLYSNPALAKDPAATWFIPMVGASGAISGVMAAYYMVYPHAHVRMLVPIFVIMTTIVVPAGFAIGYWFLIQVLSGFVASGAGGGVAWWAHVGGFVGGIWLVRYFLKPRLRQQWQLRRRWRKMQRGF